MSGQFDPRITAYFGDAVLQAGFMPIPNLFLRHYAQLGISTTQSMFLLQLMAIAWDVGSPPVNMTMLAARMGVSRRAVQLISAELSAAGIVEIFDQYDDQGAQVENGYNLAPLFEQLAALAPTRTPPGQLRQRRSRAPQQDGSTGQQVAGGQAVDGCARLPEDAPGSQEADPTPVKKTSSPPVKQISPPPRSFLHGALEVDFTGGVNPTSQLNKEVKKRVKNDLKKDQKQQQPSAAAGAAAAVGSHVEQSSIPDTDEPDEAPAGASLRWGSLLSAADIAESRQVLARMGLNADVADAVAPALHPAECWSLWTYARGARLGAAWIAKQVYDARRRAPRIAGVPGRYDDVGQLLADLPPAAAEKILDITVRCCPNQPDRLWPEGAAAGLPVPEPELRRALDMVWDALAGERGVSGRHPTGSGQHEGAAEAPVAAGADVMHWPAVRERLMSQVAPDDWNTWLAPLDLLDVVDGAAVIAVPNLFVRSEVSARFETLLAAALDAELGQELRIELVIATPAPAQWQQAHITTEALLCQA